MHGGCDQFIELINNYCSHNLLLYLQNAEIKMWSKCVQICMNRTLFIN